MEQTFANYGDDEKNLQPRRRTCVVLLAALLWSGCSEQSPAQSPASNNPAAERRLATAIQAQERLEADLSAVPERDREACEFRVGDCMQEVADQRQSLLEGEGMWSCKALPEPSSQTKCIADELSQHGKQAAVASYYEYEQTCTRQILACTADLAAASQASALETRFRARLDQVQAMPQARASQNQLEAKKAELAYLRTTLPPDASAVCDQSAEREQCEHAGDAKERTIETELRRDEADLEHAAAMHSEVETARAACYEPEIACLTDALGRYGLLPEARKMINRNFTLLEKRQELASRVSPRYRAGCMTRPTAAQQGRIVGAYVKYAHEPVLFFRTQLDKEFAALHEAQIACLTNHANVPASD